MKLYANRPPQVALPEMDIVPAPQDREWMSDPAKRCLPLRIASEAGWWILNPVRFEAIWTGAADWSGVRCTSDVPYVSTSFGDGILTLILPYMFQTPPGWNLLARGPANHPKHGIQALEGLVETDWNISTFTMNWKFTAPNVPVVFEAGEPLCQIVPQRRGDLESFEPRIRTLSGEALTRLKRWTAVRAMNRLPEPSEEQVKERKEWTGAYARGRYPDKPKRFEEHQTRLRLRELVGMRGA